MYLLPRTWLLGFNSGGDKLLQEFVYEIVALGGAGGRTLEVRRQELDEYRVQITNGGAPCTVQYLQVPAKRISSGLYFSLPSYKPVKDT